MQIPAVILAAGASRRLGEPKQLVRVEGEPLLRRTARLALEVCGPVLVVLGFEPERMKEALAGLPVVCVKNLDWAEGMASSLRVAVSALPLEAGGAVFLVCDQPRLDVEILQRMLSLHREQPARRIACGYAETRGIPAFFPREDFDALLQLRGDRGARELLLGGDVLEIDFPGGDLDLDVPEDLARLQRK